MNDSGNDFGFHLDFRNEVLNAVEQANRIKCYKNPKRYFASLPFVEKPARPLLTIFNEFLIEKGGRSAGPTRIMQVHVELHDLLVDLIRMGRVELKPGLAQLQAAFAGLVESMREWLIEDFRDPDTSDEDRDLIRDTLVYIIEHGGWENWQTDIAQWGSDDDEAA
jgi:hypothetical protein